MFHFRAKYWLPITNNPGLQEEAYAVKPLIISDSIKLISGKFGDQVSTLCYVSN